MKNQLYRYRPWMFVTLAVLVGIFAIGSVVRSQSLEMAEPDAAHAPDAPTSLLFSYQGQLLDTTNGDPITDSAVDMIFRLYNVAEDGVVCWSEDHTDTDYAVDVQDGLFNVILGQIEPIETACLTGDVYLELVVEGETMSPRELLTSVFQAQTLPDGATTQGALSVNGDLTSYGIVRGALDSTESEYTEIGHGGGNGFINTVGDGDLKFRHDENNLMTLTDAGNLEVEGQIEQFGSGGAHFYKVGIGTSPETNVGTLTTIGAIKILPSIGGAVALTTPNGNPGIRMKSKTDSFTADIRRTEGALEFAVAETTDTPPYRLVIKNDGKVGIGTNIPSAKLDVNGNMNVSGNVTCGGLVESNLQTVAERAVQSIDRFEKGDVLCWEPETDQLELCTTENNRLVMAVADLNGKPIVMGAEPVRIFGPVVAGDILVSSETPGYAMVNNDPKPGTVIAQALDDFDGEQGVIKAMIRKW